MSILGIITQVVSEAIEGKYPEISSYDISCEALAIYERVSHELSLEGLLSHCREIGAASDDINNQVIVLVLIDKFKDAKQLSLKPMAFLHQVIYVKDLDTMKRTTTNVPDFSGNFLTEISQIEARFEELEVLVKTLAVTPVNTAAVAAYLLAHVYAATIRIHYFKDGNGRVARYTVQYLLKCWGCEFLALPKVRNDQNWKNALSDAIEGKVGRLALILESRLIEAEGSKWVNPIH